MNIEKIHKYVKLFGFDMLLTCNQEVIEYDILKDKILNYRKAKAELEEYLNNNNQ